MAPVANETTYNLGEVSFGGLLQRAVIGEETYDIPEILRGAIEEALVLKGYDVSIGGPEDLKVESHPPAEAAPRSFDAVCVSAIEEWRSDKLSTHLFFMLYSIQIRSAPSGEVLFSGRFAVEQREDKSDPTGSADVVGTIRRSVRGALSSLPEADRRAAAGGGGSPKT